MEYCKVQLGVDVVRYTANPKNWEELAYTLHNEPCFLPHNPAKIEPVSQDILNMFK